jgi:hypothetical protein
VAKRTTPILYEAGGTLIQLFSDAVQSGGILVCI